MWNGQSPLIRNNWEKRSGAIKAAPHTFRTFVVKTTTTVHHSYNHPLCLRIKGGDLISSEIQNNTIVRSHCHPTLTRPSIGTSNVNENSLCGQWCSLSAVFTQVEVTLSCLVVQVISILSTSLCCLVSRSSVFVPLASSEVMGSSTGCGSVQSPALLCLIALSLLFLHFKSGTLSVKQRGSRKHFIMVREAN